MNGYSDGLGNTRLLTDETERKTDSYDYEAFGELLKSEGGSPNEYLFAGERYEAQLGLYDLRARFYEPGVGRFTQRDRLAGWERRPVTLHRYLYANGDPVNYVDPMGQMAIALWTGTRWVGAIAIGLATVGSYYGIIWVGEHFDSRKEVYLDFSEMNLCHYDNTPHCWNKLPAQDQTVEKIRADYQEYDVKINEFRGPFLQRNVNFGGEEDDFNGQAAWLRAWVYTISMMRTVKRSAEDKDPNSSCNQNRYTMNARRVCQRWVTDEELGIAIGNTASHEIGHLYAVPHDFGFPWYIMTDKMDATITPLTWSNQSKTFLMSRF